ncbi:MAG: hypothetical protein DCC49_02255 [Acidobacteria bacterium]|nr:MAG: hypothetical protein DCC49_02255 [Acidobacteriota bacterium]
MKIEDLPEDSPARVEAAMIEIVAADQGIGCADLDRAVCDRLGLDDTNQSDRALLDEVFEELIDRDYGPFALLAPDRVVHKRGLTDGITLTHRLTEAEQQSGVIGATCDLAGFRGYDVLNLADDETTVIEIWDGPGGAITWHGPPGWLDGFEAGKAVAIRVDSASSDDRGRLMIARVNADPKTSGALVAAVRAAYDVEVEEPWLPVSAEELLLAVLLDAPDAFSSAAPPLSELYHQAGLEVRGRDVAHDASVWHSLTRVIRLGRVMDELGRDSNLTLPVLRVLDTADVASGIDVELLTEYEGPPTAEDLREHLSVMSKPEVLEIVCDELFDQPYREPPAASAYLEPESRAQFAKALAGAARTRREKAIARYISAICAERSLEPEVAEEHLKAAIEADGDFEPALDRLGWYASDRGDAPLAARYWGRVATSSAIEVPLAEVREFARTSTAKMGRNEPCWCGSGRKYKQCHLGITELPPLPDRIGWLCRKATCFLERRGRNARMAVMTLASARAVDPHDNDSILEALSDPIVIDLALTEGGWFERFLEERGPLLPEDESVLAHSWLFVERSVFEVIDVEAGEGLTLRDLRTGESVEVRERSFSEIAHPKMMICARPVPDGGGYQFVGGIIVVEPGHERGLLAILDDGDPYSIAEWFSAAHAPPRLANREGDDLVLCEIELEVANPPEAVDFLDANFEGERDGWVEVHDLDEDESIIRAQLALNGSRLTVNVNSEERARRVLALLDRMPGGCLVVSERREPLDVATVQARASEMAESAGASLSDEEIPLEARALMAEYRDRYEERWCEQPVPALGGLTPREAAEDPTRREELDRLIASFERESVADSEDFDVVMRPARLRELLGM